jgi:hypothetical protein
MGMKNRTPPRPAGHPAVPDFTPVPRRPRTDGWTPERQRAFIEALAETGSVKAAAHRINMSSEGAYYLRRQPGAESFAAAWEAALDFGVQRLADIALERAVDGVSVPVFWKGEQVGERRAYNDRLLMFMLRKRLPERYGDGAGAGASAGLDAADEERLRAEWEAERAAANLQLKFKAADVIRRNIDLYRLHFLKSCEKDPARRAAWELLAGPTEWDKVRTAGVDDDFGFARETNSRPSTILVLAGFDGLVANLDAETERHAPAAEACEASLAEIQAGTAPDYPMEIDAREWQRRRGV